MHRREDIQVTRDIEDVLALKVAALAHPVRIYEQWRVLVADRTFEPFRLDVGYGDPVPEPPDRLSGPLLLEFAGIDPALVPCYLLAQQIAEKVHAYTRLYLPCESTRLRDWHDILWK